MYMALGKISDAFTFVAMICSSRIVENSSIILSGLTMLTVPPVLLAIFPKMPTLAVVPSIVIIETETLDFMIKTKKFQN